MSVKGGKKGDKSSFEFCFYTIVWCHRSPTKVEVVWVNF